MDTNNTAIDDAAEIALEGNKIPKNHIFIKCEMCNSNYLSLVCLSDTDYKRENGKNTEAFVTWMAICNNCGSVSVISELWITAEKIITDLLEMKKQKDKAESNMLDSVDLDKIIGLINQAKQKN